MSAVVMKKTDIEKVQKARLAFIVGVMDLSWKLAVLFLTPVIIGFSYDAARGSEKGVLLGSIIGLLLAVMYIFKMGLEANKK